MSQILLYQSEYGRTKLDVRLENETLWLNQKQLTELFGKAKGIISEHIKHIFEDGELEEISVVRLFRTTAFHFWGSGANGTGLSLNRQGWLSKPSGKGCGTIQDESGSIPPSTPDT